ncbi:MAG: BA14K family protein [Rhizobiaceae bacterium]|nr:BA14K family protein [Rhizobiaceae bacterium]
MKKFMVTLCAAALSIGTAVSTAAPVAAAPFVPAPAQAALSSDVIQIRDRNWRRPGFHHREGRAYYNGHRGYRHYRPGYRRYNDFWFPAGAFVAGALLGGALSAPAPVYREPTRRVYMGNDHVRWCYNRYRSYRASDNTFQPYNGPRQQCYSPYN